MNNLDAQLKELYKEILSQPRFKTDRTGYGTKSIFGKMMRFNMQDGFPLTTLRKIHIKSLIHELLWFLGSYEDKYKQFGNTNIKYLLDNGVTFWTDWCYKNYKDAKVKKHQLDDLKDSKTVKKLKLLSQKDFEKKIIKDDEFALKWGELGPVYGKQWKDWGGYYEMVEKTKLLKETKGEQIIVDKLGWEKIYLKGINQIDNLINMILENPDSRRLIVNAWNVAEIDDMLLPPCFEYDQKILTNNGYKNIINVLNEDKLYTHNGNYEKINKKYVTKYSGDIYNLRIRYSPYDINCTPNHPFLIKDKGFIEIKDIKNEDYVGIKINNKNIIPKIDVDQYSDNKINKYIIDSKDEFFMMGYFLGDGWTIESDKSKNKYRIFFSFNKKDTDTINKIKKVLSISKNMEGKNIIKYESRNKKWYKILSEFGKYAHNKTIPEWIIDSPKHLIEEFIDGYVSADGNIKNGNIRITTVSDNIAFNIQRLFAKLGKVASLVYQKRNPKTIIEGRLVNQKNTYNISVNKKYSKNLAIFDDDYLWLKIRKITKSYKNTEVYNFDVNIDHTYTVQNFVTHNCHMMYQFYTDIITMEERIDYCEKHYKVEDVNKFMVQNNISDWDEIKRDPRKQIKILDHFNVPERKIDLQMYQRSQDCYLGQGYNIAMYSLLLHMVAQCVNMIPNEFIQTIGDAHVYANAIEATEELLKREPRKLPTLWLNPDIQNIYGFREEDIKIFDYDPHPNIKVDVAV